MTDGLALLAVDDERPALEDLVRMLRASPLVASVDRAASASSPSPGVGVVPAARCTRSIASSSRWRETGLTR